MSDFSNLVFNKSDSKETNLKIVQHLVGLGYSELVTSRDYLDELECTTHIVGGDSGNIFTTNNPDIYSDTIYDFESYLKGKEEKGSKQTPKTPYQEKGYTENSLFKFVGEDGEFEEGEILKLNYDDGTFTLSYISTTTSDVSYLYFNEVEYVGEEGDEDVVKQPPNYEETLIIQTLKDSVKQDNVNHPNHYKTGKTECIVAMEEMLSTEEFIGYLRGNIYKYTYRYKDKNGVEDLKKAQWYLNKLIEKEQQKEESHG